MQESNINKNLLFLNDPKVDKYLFGLRNNRKDKNEEL